MAPWSADTYWTEYETHRAASSLDRAVTPRRRRDKRADDRSVNMAILGKLKSESEADAIEARFSKGFSWDGGVVDGHYIPPFTDEGLPSTGHAMLRLFVTKLRAGRKLKAGDTRGWMVDGLAKLLGLDKPFVVANSKMRGLFVVPLKGVWASKEALLAEIDGRGVQRPNIVSGFQSDLDAPLENPALIWVLRWSVGGNSRKARAAYRATLRSLTFALLEIGATTECLRDGAEFKNPLFPGWTRFVTAADPYQLGATNDQFPQPDLTTGLPRNVTNEQLGIRVTVEKKASRATPFQNALRSFACREVVGHIGGGHRDAFRAAVRLHALTLAPEFGEDVVQALMTASSTSSWVWANHRPELAVRWEQWRPCAAQTAVLATVAEKQAVGARYSSELVHNRNVRRMVDAWLKAVGNGRLLLSKSLLAKLSGLSLSTVYRRFDEVLQAVREQQEVASQAILIRSSVIQLTPNANDKMTPADTSNGEPTASQSLVQPFPRGRPRFGWQVSQGLQQAA